MPKVSFVVAIYNVREYIEDCVRSLYGQTLEDIEIVLVDDCSPDDSLDIALKVLEEYPHRKGQVKVVRHEQNQGLGIGRQNGARAATGDYVSFIDGDDWVDVRMGELLYANAVSEKSDIVLCDICKYSEEVKRRYSFEPGGIEGNGENVRDDVLNRTIDCYVWGKIIRRELLLNDGVVWAKRNYWEDVVLVSSLVYYASKISLVREMLYFYRSNPESILGDRSLAQLRKNCEDALENYDVYIQFMEREQLTEKYRRGVMLYKVDMKAMLAILSSSNADRRRYRETFPEVDRFYFLGDGSYSPTWRERFRIAAWWLGLMPRFHRLIDSKYLRPRTSLMSIYIKCSYK